MSVNKRVEQVIEKIAKNKSSFSTATGISTVILSHISSGRNKVSLGAITQILEAYPTINPNWLVMGQGTMFIDSTQQNTELLNELNELKQSLERFTSKTEIKLTQLIDKLSQ